MADSELTAALSDTDDGGASGKRLLPLVYSQLRAIAQQRLSHENPGHTLQATALVHEAYLKLAVGRDKPWTNRAHFYAAAAEAMRLLLIDHARGKYAQKRGGGGAKRLPPESIADTLAGLADLAAAGDSGTSEKIVMFDEAFLRLEAENPDAAGVVRLRFFAGLSVDQTAEALGLSPATVDRRWSFARAWLHRNLTQGD